MATWDRRLTAATERLDGPPVRRAPLPPRLPDGLHPDDAAAAEAILRVAADRRSFATSLLVRKLDEPDEPFARLRIETVASGVRVRVEEIIAGSVPLSDPLTELPGRAVLLDRIANALAATSRLGTKVAVLYVDVDGFKLLNDAFGYAGGDEVLCWVADRLAGAIRPGDTLARLSGDEFVVVAPGVSDDVDALRVGDRLRAAMTVAEGDVPPIAGLSVSIGIACGAGNADAGELISHADTALYLAKASGRDRCQLFDDALRSRVERRVAVDQQLRRALDDGTLDVHFQPIVTAVGAQPVGVEALVRIATVDGVDVHPHELLRAATDNGLLRRVEGAVLGAACAQVAAWDDIGQPLTLSVNLTERQFRDHELLRTVNRALRATGLAPDRLSIEITEPTIADDTNAARGTISRLRSLGVRVVVDEFCGSQVLMRLLPGLGVEQIKLDRSLVNALDREWGRTVVASSIDKAAELGLKVSAVGVETKEQLAFLADAGCALVQGYLFERPLPANRVPAALARLTAG